MDMRTSSSPLTRWTSASTLLQPTLSASKSGTFRQSVLQFQARQTCSSRGEGPAEHLQSLCEWMFCEAANPSQQPIFAEPLPKWLEAGTWVPFGENLSEESA